MLSRRTKKGDRNSNEDIVVLEDDDDYVVVAKGAASATDSMEVATGRSFTTSSSSSSSHTRLHTGSNSSLTQPGSHHGSQYSSYSHPSRSSDSTQDTAASSLFNSPPSTASNAPSSTTSGSGTVVANKNVINRVADKEASLFQICLIQRNRLKAVPGFEDQIHEIEDAAEDDGPIDPVTLLWRTYRKGFPLLTIYNALQPAEPLTVDDSARMSDAKREKIATFNFLKACVDKLKFPTEECFILNDLYGEDTTGFVKVANVVNRIIDMLVQRGLMYAYDDSTNQAEAGGGGGPLTKRTHRQNVIDELVRTERTYVQHIELLQEFKMLVTHKGIIPGDAIHNIFLNLDVLLDFQRRFLIRVEQINALPEDEQNWGELFKAWSNHFRFYEPFILNQKQCEATAMKEFDKLKETGGRLELRQLVESPTYLTAFLLKPFQRLAKYPLLLQQLRDKGDLDQKRQDDLTEGIEAVSSILERTNACIAREERLQALENLKVQIEDWRSHDVNAFGELLLYGTFQVLKGDGQNTPREYKVYLFERILLCCKEINVHKPKNKMKANNQNQSKPKPKMQLRGRIFMQNVSDCIFYSQPGTYSCQIFWRSDEQDEYFTIHFPTEDIMKQWRNRINEQRRVCTEQAKVSGQPPSRPPSGTSNTELYSIRDQPQMENPYLHDNYAEEDEDADSVEYQSRNGSSASLRSRSGTGDSGPVMSQASARPAYPAGIAGAPLSLRTQQLSQGSGGGSPAERGGTSYFSPVADSPMSASARTSNSSGVFAFPRPGGHHEDQNRFTAPALGRTPNGYYTDQRNGRGGGQQGHVSAPHPAAASNQNRLRSTSNPDIQHRKPLANAPPVPTVPSHLTQHSGLINRSQSNSPTNANGMLAKPPTSHSPLSQQHGHAHHDSQTSLAAAGGGHHHHHHHHQQSATSPLAAAGSAFSPEDQATPSQLKVKVKVPSEGCTMMLVVSYNISFQSLKDRIDAKLQRNTSLSLANGSVVLKYLYDGVFCSIQNDEDVQTAFESWKEQQTGDYLSAGHMGEIELFCHPPKQSSG